MNKILFVMVILIAGPAFGADSIREEIGLTRTCERSKDPRCWEPRHLGGIQGQPYLDCQSDGSVHLGGSLGDGPGCNEGPRLVLNQQKIEVDSQQVHVSTSQVFRPLEKPYACHYWGPLYGSVALHLVTGTWSVYADGVLAGVVELEVERKVLDGKLVNLTTCKLSQ